MITYSVKLLTLQQYLPFTVLKHYDTIDSFTSFNYMVATVLTVYGIETIKQ